MCPLMITFGLVKPACCPSWAPVQYGEAETRRRLGLQAVCSRKGLCLLMLVG